MKNLLTVRNICDRYGCKEKTARRYMRQMEHMEKPLRVTESAVESWEINRTYNPEATTETTIKSKRSSKIDPPGKYIIPRKRPARTEALR